MGRASPQIFNFKEWNGLFKNLNGLSKLEEPFDERPFKNLKGLLKF